MENRYNYRAFINDNLDLYGYKENSLLSQLGAPSIKFYSDHVDLDFFRERENFHNDVNGAPKKPRRFITYGFILSISSQGVRLSRIIDIRPESKRKEYEIRMIEEIVNVEIAILSGLGKYTQ